MDKALEAKEIADTTHVNIDDLEELSEERRKFIREKSGGNLVTLFSLPGDNVCVPLLCDDLADRAIQYTHIRDDKVRQCKYKTVVNGTLCNYYVALVLAIFRVFQFSPFSSYCHTRTNHGRSCKFLSCKFGHSLTACNAYGLQIKNRR